MEYMVRDKDGTEYGPVSQDELVSWAKEERIVYGSEVRNKLFKNWRVAEAYEFLKPYLVHKDTDETPVPVVTPSKKDLKQHLGEAPIFRFTPAGLFHRTTAYILDVSFITAVWLVLSYVVVGYLPEETILTPEFTAVSIASYCFIYLLYFTLTIGLQAQTVGQSFYGMIVVNGEDGSPILTGTAFVYSLLLMVMWPLAPFGIIVTPAKRALHDYMSKTRVIYLQRKALASKK